MQASDDDILHELRRLPKPPVDDVVTSVGMQAKVIALTAISMMLLATGLYGISQVAVPRGPWEVAAAVISALSFSPLLISAILALWVYVQGKKRRQLASGEYYVHWLYAPDQWADHCEQSKSKLSKVVLIISLCCTGVGLVLALMVHFDDDKLFLGSVFSHYAVCLGCGAVFGVAVGMFCRYCGNITHNLKLTRTAQSLIGPGGVYITGQFSPLSTFGHQLLSAQIAQDDPDNILFIFRVKTKHGYNETPLLLPIPPDQRHVAEVLINMLESES